MSDAQIFQVFSLVCLAIGIGMLINRDFYKKLFADFCENTSVMYTSGIMAIVVGYLILAFHNTWTKDLSVIITVMGWLTLIKGILILALPKIMIALTRAMLKENLLRIMTAWVIFVGLVFSFLGFCPKNPI